MRTLEIAQKIRQRRIGAGVSQEALAKSADISTDLLVRLENGRHTNPTIKTVEKIMDALDRMTKETA